MVVAKMIMIWCKIHQVVRVEVSLNKFTSDLQAEQFLAFRQDSSERFNGLFQVQYSVFFGQSADGVLMSSPLYYHRQRHDGKTCGEEKQQ